MNSTASSVCQNIPVSVDLHPADQKEGQSVGNAITQPLPPDGQKVQPLAHRNVVSMQGAARLVNPKSGGVESGHGSDDDYSDHPSLKIRREYQELQRLQVIIDQMREIRANAQHAEYMIEAGPVVASLSEEFDQMNTLHQLRAEGYFEKGIESPPTHQSCKKQVRELAIRIIRRIIPCFSENHGR